MTNNRVSALTATVIVSLALAASVRAGDWPHWRGPHFNGSCDEKNLPTIWGETENVAWRAPLPGHSSATPVIAGGRVFVSSTESDSDDLFALCFDARSGEEPTMLPPPTRRPAGSSGVTDTLAKRARGGAIFLRSLLAGSSSTASGREGAPAYSRSRAAAREISVMLILPGNSTALRRTYAPRSATKAIFTSSTERAAAR